MIAATKIESFCVDAREKWAFAGNSSGQISVIDIEDFSVRNEVQAHAGVVQAMACHSREPYVAALSTDRHVTVWRYDECSPELAMVCKLSLRDVQPDNDVDEVACVHSTSQAIGFHDRRLRVVTRSANAGLLEFDFSPSGAIRILTCRRLHGSADLVSARYARDSDQVLSGSIDGQLILSSGGEVVRQWQLGDAVVHWAEHVRDESYLLASDMRFVARVNLSSDDVLVGPQFTHDDLEHVTLNDRSGRAFVGSFDRNIYEIDPDTCVPTRVAFEAPFKCRWVKTLERSPATGLVQCRDGGLYKVNVDTGSVLGTLKSTPPALWTCVVDGRGALVMAGEGETLLRLHPRGVDPVARVPRFSKTSHELHLGDGSYTKRAVSKATGELYLGRTSGSVYAVDGEQSRVVATLPSAVRDLALDSSGAHLFVACEDGTVQKLHSDSGESEGIFRSRAQQPFWSLAYNAERHLLAVAERRGCLSILDGESLEERIRGIVTGRPKRMKWVDADLLLYNFRDEIRSFDIATGSRRVRVPSVGNTIEDFIWDTERRYLVCISYTQNLYLHDFDSGERINWVPDQMDYSKGMSWVPRSSPGDYPLDFITFGRSGAAHLFRIHDEKILALGPI